MSAHLDIPNPLAQSKIADFRNAHAALLRAAQLARDTAKQFNTHLIVYRNGQIVKLEPHEA